MRWISLIAVALALGACGSSASGKPVRVEYGRTGGNIRPFRKAVEPSGAVASRLRGAVFAGLTSRQCPGTLPDFATEYIRFNSRTVRVRGNCEPAFTRLWNELLAATR